MIVAIIGSRDHPFPRVVDDYVNALPSDTIVVSGGARGVDAAAMKAAKARGLRGVVVRPGSDSDRLDYHARNDAIIALADRIVAFHDGRSPGTASVIRKARERGVPVETITLVGALEVRRQEPKP